MLPAVTIRAAVPGARSYRLYLVGFHGQRATHKLATTESCLSEGRPVFVIGVPTPLMAEMLPGRFFSATGYNYVRTAVTGSTAGLHMSGWLVNWIGGDINMAWRRMAAR